MELFISLLILFAFDILIWWCLTEGFGFLDASQKLLQKQLHHLHKIKVCITYSSGEIAATPDIVDWSIISSKGIFSNSMFSWFAKLCSGSTWKLDRTSEVLWVNPTYSKVGKAYYVSLQSSPTTWNFPRPKIKWIYALFIVVGTSYGWFVVFFSFHSLPFFFPFSQWVSFWSIGTLLYFSLFYLFHLVV